MDPNIKIVSRSLTNMMLVGVLLVLIGALVLFARAKAGEASTIDTVTLWSCAAVFLGAAILCFRYGVMFDRQQRTVARWRGLLLPHHKSAARPLAKNCYVSLSNSPLYDPSKKATPLDSAAGTLVKVPDVFSVRLEAPGAAAMFLQEAQDYDGARHFAEGIAKFLNVELRDRCFGVETVRAAGQLDEPLRERVRRSAGSVQMPARIEGAKAIFSPGGPAAPSSIELPPAGIDARSVLKAALAAGSLLLVAIMGSAKSRDPGFLKVLLVAALVVGPVLAGRLLFRAARYREHIAISPNEIVISQYSSGIETTRLTAAEIEEIVLIKLRYPRSFRDSMSRVVIRSDQGSVELGATLANAEEVRWLRDVLIHVLSSDSHQTGTGGPA